MSNTTAKERPILFNGDMVRAILDGRKTQTRRVVKIPKGWSPESPEGSSLVLGQITSAHPKKGKFGLFITRTDDGFIQHDIVPCPYGQQGDRLWVRETFSVNFCGGVGIQSGAGPRKVYQDFEIEYRAGGDPMAIERDYYDEYLTRLFDTQIGDWRPSIHMPRWASRITLEITGVRVERLQDISEEGAKAEGMFFTNYGKKCFHGGQLTDVGDCSAPDEHHPQRNGWSWKETSSSDECLGAARWAFANLWGSINGPESWDANPLVWVVEFRRLP